MPRRHRPLLVTGPWYRWGRQQDEEGLAPRATRPGFQKYDGAKLVQHFLADPQRTYRFTDEDHVHVTEDSPFTSPIRKLADVRRERSDVRKLFRAVHRRTYLVVGELHCDGPGLPDADPAVTCEMGMVVRRRVPRDRAAIASRRAELREAIGVDRAQVLALEWARLGVTGRGSLRSDPRAWELGSPFRRSLPLSPAEATRLLGLYHQELSVLRAEQAGLVALDASRVPSPSLVEADVQGWFPDPDREGVGEWRTLDEPEPAGRVEEKVHALSPLVPDPRRVPDPARGASLLFGMAPVDEAEVDPAGVPRFDGESVYEVRLYVRRHDERCPRTGRRNDCRGPIAWSRPTEAFRVAPHDDVDGTRHNVVTLPMPDLRELAAAVPPGGVRMVSPDGSNLRIEADGSDVTGGSLGVGQICSLPILLITLVARFLFALFLPVVVLAFQLFFLLRLKICIPPSVEVRAELTAAVAAAGPSIDASLDVRAELRVQFNTMFGAPPAGPGPGNDLVAEYTNTELLAMLDDLATHAGPEPPVGGGDELAWDEVVTTRPRMGVLAAAGVSA